MHKKAGCDTDQKKRIIVNSAIAVFIAVMFLVPGLVESLVKSEGAPKRLAVIPVFCAFFAVMTLLSIRLHAKRAAMLKSKNLALSELENCLKQNMAEHKRIELALQESERIKSMLLTNLQGMSYRCSNQSQMAFDFVSEGCFDLTGYCEQSLLNNQELSYSDLIPEEYKASLIEELEEALVHRRPFKSEYEIIDALGCRKWVMEIGQGLFDDCGNVEALEGFIVDITQAKMRQEKIDYLRSHDLMTGFYKRHHFNEILQEMDQRQKILPISVLVANINGMRFTNDVFGYSIGDRIIGEAARIIHCCCRENYLTARTDGDEFTVLMPGAGKEEASALMYRIKEEITASNARNQNNGLHYFDISISFGYNTKEKSSENIEDVLNIAVDYMRRRKMLNRDSSHSSILTSIKATMYERSQETQEHATRLARISKSIALELELEHNSIDEIELFAMLHDIGKIGINDRILKKPGRLSEEEWVEMKKHPEIGYRIAKSSPDLVKIADYIMSHHENWDGSGYPRGLKGQNIPLPSRILAIADAFDAMTENRVYRKAMGHREALAEIKAKSGSQFDPYIVDIFIKMEGLKEINEFGE